MNDACIAISLPSKLNDTRIDMSVSVSAFSEIVTLICTSFMCGELVGKDSFYLSNDEARKLSIMLYQALNAKGGS